MRLMTKETERFAGRSDHGSRTRGGGEKSAFRENRSFSSGLGEPSPREEPEKEKRELSLDGSRVTTARGGVSVRVRAAYLSGSVPLTRGRGGVASLRLAAPRAGVAGERVPRSRGRADPHPLRVSALRKHNPTGTRDARERALGARGCARDAHDAARGLTAAGAAVERGLKRTRGVRHRERAGESRHGR
jgi:hypothetical protein